MPVINLNTPTELLLQWGWFLVTRANGVVYLLVIAMFLAGMLVRLPRGKRDIAAAQAVGTASPEVKRPEGDA
jgi:hypothetical protein